MNRNASRIIRNAFSVLMSAVLLFGILSSVPAERVLVTLETIIESREAPESLAQIFSVHSCNSPCVNQSSCHSGLCVALLPARVVVVGDSEFAFEVDQHRVPPAPEIKNRRRPPRPA